MQRHRSVLMVAELVTAAAVLFGLSPLALAEEARSRHGCSVRTLDATYGFYRTGFTPDGPLAALGFWDFDGRGGATGSQSISRNGEYEMDLPLDFFYEVDDGCTGRGLNLGGEEVFRLMVVDDARTIYFFSEVEGNVVYGIATRVRGPESRKGNLR